VLRKTIDEFDAYMSRLAEERRQEPAEDLLTALVRADEQGQRLSAQELQGTLSPAGRGQRDDHEPDR
jgi:cytochrome P450